jgi:alpha-galactosidase
LRAEARIDGSAQGSDSLGDRCWRTAGDPGFELDRIFPVALKNAQHRAWSKPGAWNDPDYIQIGYIGDARAVGELKPCPLSPDEQYAFMSLWSPMAAPLFYCGDMSKPDEFTLNVLCNPEVIDVNQDPLGQCATVDSLSQDTFVMVKEMADGSKAIGLCNRSGQATDVAATWADGRLVGKKLVRDVWRQKDMGVYENCYAARVPKHGVVLIRVRNAG